MHMTPFPSLARAKIAGRAHAESGSLGTVYVLRRDGCTDVYWRTSRKVVRHRRDPCWPRCAAHADPKDAPCVLTECAMVETVQA